MLWFGDAGREIGQGRDTWGAIQVSTKVSIIWFSSLTMIIILFPVLYDYEKIKEKSLFRKQARALISATVLASATLSEICIYLVVRTDAQ